LKTTLEIPEATLRKAKTRAAANGITLKQLVTEALEAWLGRVPGSVTDAAPPWMGVW
jgi:predicted DNA binding CopG/RHH family protein